jgi:hypothetical protein
MTVKKREADVPERAHRVASDNPDLDPSRQESIDKKEAPPLERASPAKRTSEKLDEEE